MLKQNRHGQRSSRPPWRMMPRFYRVSPIAGKPVQVTFDAGRLTSDGGVLVLAEIERRLGMFTSVGHFRSEDLQVHETQALLR